ncbi:MAG: extensin family protein [Pseudomonadota bacterium]
MVFGYEKTVSLSCRIACLVVIALALVACAGGEKRPSRGVGDIIDSAIDTRSIFSLPKVTMPGFGGASSGVMPASERQCRARLRRLGVKYKDLAPIRDSAHCGIAHPVEVTTFARGVAVKPAAVLNCGMAEETARWVQGDLAVASRTRYLSGISEIRQMSAYSCRRIRGSSTWSEHSKGNAIDIGSIKLDSGKVIDVARPHFFAMRERAYLHRVRTKACDHFSTVLGPGSDADHRDHFHFDLRQRRSGYRHCD